MARPPNPDATRYPEFAERMRCALNEAGITGSYKEIGKRLGVTPTTVGNLVNGIKLPSMDTAIHIAMVTGVSVDWLMTGKGEKRPRKAAEELLDIGDLSDDAKAAIRALVYSFEKPHKQGNHG